MYQANYIKDGTSFNAYIDTLTEVLQSHKTIEVPKEINPEAPKAN